MKKIILATLFFPIFAFANSTSFLSISVGEMSNGVTDIDGYSVSFSNVVDDKVLVGLSHLEGTGDFDGSISGVSAAYAFDSFSSGSMYVGISYADSDLAEDSTTGYSIGYSKISGNGTDYDLSVATAEGLVGYGVSVTADSGLSFGISESNGISLVSVGFRIALN